jgi:hypothetical protein
MPSPVTSINDENCVFEKEWLAVHAEFCESQIELMNYNMYLETYPRDCTSCRK